jgi:polysaccharide chain length determinant protein (PEP-CTERM system associated)
MNRDRTSAPREIVLDATPTGPVRELSALLEAPFRHPFLLLVPFVLVTALAVGLGFVLTKRYETWAVILLENQKAPNALTRGSDESAKPKVLTLRQEMLTRVRLERILRELDPYPKLMATQPLYVVLDKMRKGIDITQKGSDAFGIAYENSDPQKAMLVLNRLVNLFVEETNDARSEQVEGTAEFLETQLQEARQQLEEKEREIRGYKEANRGRLPDQMPGNLATLQRLQAEQQAFQENLRLAREKRAVLERGGVSAVAVGEPGAVPSAALELQQLRSQLASLRTRYTDEHPDVRALASRVARLEAEVAKGPGERGVPAFDPARAQLEAVVLDVQRLEARDAEIDKRIQGLQGRVDTTPQTEQGLATLTRDYEKLNENYVNLFKKKLDAELAKRLEQRWQGVRYRILEPAYLPETPSFPKPWLFGLLGAILGLGTGLGAALTAELLDHSVKRLREVEENLPFPVLAVFPPCGPSPSWRAATAARPQEAARVWGPETRAPRGGGGFGGAALLMRPAAGGEFSPEEVTFSETPQVVLSTALAPMTLAALSADSVIAEEFRSLGARIRALGSERPARCIGLVSALEGEGKTTIAIGLAAALAREPGRKVLLIEADLRKPAVDDYLGIALESGLGEWLLSKHSRVSVRQLAPLGFALLGAGRGPTPSHEMFGSDRMAHLLKAARRSFDYVLLDCPPLLPVADAVMLQDFVDGFLLVIRARRSPIEAIQRAISTLKPDRIRGLVVNAQRELLPGYYKYAYPQYREYGYGKGYGKGEAGRG